MEKLKGVLREEKTLVRLGLLGIVLAIFCGIVYLLKGGLIPPHGELIKPITFDLAIGLFLLTTALYLPYAAFSEKGRRKFRSWTMFYGIYFYAAETIQTLRGVDPRFAQSGWDMVQGIAFGLVSVMSIVMNIILAVAFFRKAARNARPTLVLGIRYGFVSVMLGFAAGLWMVAKQGHLTGLGGNILAIHFLGFHGLQAIPFMAWLLEKSPVSRERAARLVHTAGAVWLLAVFAAFIQTAWGKTLAEPSIAAVSLYLLLIVWFSMTVNAVMMAWRNKTEWA